MMIRTLKYEYYRIGVANICKKSKKANSIFVKKIYKFCILKYIGTMGNIMSYAKLDPTPSSTFDATD